MRSVVNLPLSSADDLTYFTAECIVVPNERRMNLPEQVCVACSPMWLELHELGLDYCRVWARVVEAVAAGNFDVAAKRRSGLEPASIAIDRLLAETLREKDRRTTLRSREKGREKGPPNN